MLVPQAISLDTTATNSFPAVEGMQYLAYTNTGNGGDYATGSTYADGTLMTLVSSRLVG